MSQPGVTITELDGAIGVLPSTSKLFALAGVSSTGPLNTPATFAKTRDVIATFGDGPLVEDACYYIERFGRPVVITRTGQSVQGSYLDAVSAANGTISAITKTGTGTSVFTNNSSVPLVAANVKVLFNVGGTRGTAGIVYQISLDGGQTWGPPLALGTAITFDIGASGASIAIGAGTVVAGDFIEFTLTAPVPASAGLVVHSGLQNAPSIDAATHPHDDYEVVILFVAGGTRGISGVTYKWSLDGGRTYSPVTGLGTATSIVIPGSGGVKVDLGTGTIAAGARIAFPTVAPRWNTSELGTALDALKNSAVSWELVHVVGPIDGDAFDLLELKLAGMAAVGKPRAWIGNTRMPVGAESESTYLTSLSGVFGSKAALYGMLCAGACRLTSSVSSRKYRRPVAFAVAALEGSVSEEINTADINLGALVGVGIADANGNPVEHDESVNPGLDDARFCVLRSWEGEAGVYINRPRLFSAEGSDFQLLPHRRVMNLARVALNAYFRRRLNKPVLVDKNTGFILESEALEIESGARSVLAAVLLAKPKASAVSFVLSRTDNLLSTKTMTGTAGIVPLAYPEQISLELGFINPALQIQAVAA